MLKQAIIFIAMAAIIALPLLFRLNEEAPNTTGAADDILIVITPHTNALIDEVDKNFKKWYKQKTGRSISIDWRKPGGVSEIFKYLDSIYSNAFRLYWENNLGKSWNTNIQYAYKNYRLDDGKPEEHNSIEVEARQAFLASHVGGDIDVVFGGGLVNFAIQKKVGILAPFGLFNLHPEWFNPEIIPASHAGTLLYDPEGYWFGTTLSTFGIIYNKETLEHLNFNKQLTNWSDLADPAFFGEIAATDPTKSGSMSTTFEMIVQNEMHTLLQQSLKNNQNINLENIEEQVLSEGWLNALRTLQKIAANTRNFTERSGKTILDVSSGNCAAGIAIDYQAYTHAKNLEHRSESERLSFVMPKNGTALSPDCIGLLRGSPHPEAGKLFIEYTLTMEGQKLSAFKPGTPGGPEEYVLCRSAIRKDFYKNTNPAYWFDPENNPYNSTNNFTYRKEWTQKVYEPLRFIMKVAFINAHSELQSAWNAIIEAQKDGNLDYANQALALFNDLPLINYKEVVNSIYPILSSGDPLKQIELETKITKSFIKKYKQVELLAKKGAY